MKTAWITIQAATINFRLLCNFPLLLKTKAFLITLLQYFFTKQSSQSNEKYLSVRILN